MVRISRVMLLDVAQQLDLVEGLVEEVLVVLDDLDADHLAGEEVDALHRLREGGRAQVLLHLPSREGVNVHCTTFEKVAEPKYSFTW